MKKSYSFRCIFFVLIFLTLGFTIFFLKTSVHSTTDTSGISLENNPRGIATNPNTNIAIIANEKAALWLYIILDIYPGALLLIPQFLLLKNLIFLLDRKEVAA